MHPVKVIVHHNHPFSLMWQQRKLAIEDITDHWREFGRWWDGETTCDYYLSATSRGMFLLCHNIQTDLWQAKHVQ
jgi:hypothetical protein